MRAAEITADDVWLALASVEETARLCGELGLVAGPAVQRQAPFEVGVDQLVGVQLGRVRRQEVQLDNGGRFWKQGENIREVLNHCGFGTT